MRNSIGQLLDSLREWAGPASEATDSTLRLACTIEGPAEESTISSAWPALSPTDEIVQFWRQSRSARLFEDVDYGQWGLRLLDPAASAERTASERSTRPGDYLETDVVVGEFLGDQELLVLERDGGSAAVVIALPLDSRQDWYRASASLVEFLDRYLAASGDKFWE